MYDLWQPDQSVFAIFKQAFRSLLTRFSTRCGALALWLIAAYSGSPTKSKTKFILHLMGCRKTMIVFLTVIASFSTWDWKMPYHKSMIYHISLPSIFLLLLLPRAIFFPLAPVMTSLDLHSGFTWFSQVLLICLHQSHTEEERNPCFSRECFYASTKLALAERWRGRQWHTWPYCCLLSQCVSKPSLEDFAL